MRDNIPTRSRKRAIAEINVVPYIDVMLVLLVIFMIIAPAIQQSKKVALPKTTKVPPGGTNKVSKIIITIDKDGNTFLHVDAKDHGKQGPGQIGAAVTKGVASNPKMSVEIYADENTEYENVLNTIAVLKTAGATDVRLVTQPGEDDV